MGITLQGAGAIGSGLVEGFQSQRADNRAQAGENRSQVQETERLEAKRRQEELNQILSELPGMLKPGQEPMPQSPPGPATAIPAGPPAAGAPPPVGGGTPPPAAGAPPPVGGGTPPPAAGAIPGAPPGPEGLSTMDVAGTADPTGPRDRIAALREQALKSAAASGGMQAMDTVGKFFDMQIQGQMYDYATEGIRAVAGGTAGEAVKFLNTAMEIATVDPGIEFFAMNGEVYGQRGNGEPRKYTQEDLVGLTKSYLMNPENYLAWQKQILEEKKADTDKTYKEGVIEVARDEVDIKEGTAPYQRAGLAASATAALMNATTAQDKAAALAKAKGLGWDENNYLKINDVASTFLDKGILGVDGEWWGQAQQNPQIGQNLLGGVVNIIGNNSPDKANYPHAVMLSQLALSDSAGIDIPAGTTLPPIKEANGEYFAQIDGTEYWIPASVYLGIQQAKMVRREQ